MRNAITFVGLDAHARFVKAVSLDVMTGELKSATFEYDNATVARWASSLPQPARCVCESGVPASTRRRSSPPWASTRLRHRVQDDQARSRQAKEELPQRHRVPGSHAVRGQRGGSLGTR